MRKTISYTIIFIYSIITSFGQGFEVKNFTADIYLSEDGYFDVVEKYDLNFTEPKHGILRNIQTKFNFKDENGQVTKREIYISNIEVPDRVFTTNEVLGKLLSNQFEIKIGDKNQFVYGAQQYEIKYRVKNALIFNDSIVQLYWNVKPPEWMAIFYKVNFTVHAPEGANFSAENSFVYSGNIGNTQESQEFDYHYSLNEFSVNSRGNFISVPQQSVTVLVKLPKTLIKETDFTPSFFERYKWLGYFILALVGLLVYLKYIINSKKVKPITSYYPPNGLDPAMAGVLSDNTADFRDITCLLPYWATKGIIRMEEIPKGDRSILGDLKLIKLKELPSDSAGYEHNFFTKIFLGKDQVLVRNLRGILAEPVQLLNKKSQQYFSSSSKTSKRFGCFIMLLSWIWAFSSISWIPIILETKYKVNINQGKFILIIIANFIFFFIFFPIIVAYISKKLKNKNNQGQSFMPELVGFYQFIKLAEVDRIKALLKDDPNYFEKTMPYAVAFNLLKEWTAKFDSLNISSPEWYGSTSGNHFNMQTFATSFNNNMSTVRNSMVTSPSSSSSSHSGGGSSGGGAGGGGGGSW
ncbi:MAG TPA: DUF2207 domain-containing protein [Edaphocola sp.]|nr:DUF2207 domain-containing protein [Edaphocola sp.]